MTKKPVPDTLPETLTPAELFLSDMIGRYFQRNDYAKQVAGTPEAERAERLAHWSWLALNRVSMRFIEKGDATIGGGTDDV